ncbi:hypothetical protein ABBQ38_000460 [Trebouxia sp. C0009 RCD-2024]
MPYLGTVLMLLQKLTDLRDPDTVSAYETAHNKEFLAHLRVHCQAAVVTDIRAFHLHAKTEAEAVRAEVQARQDTCSHDLQAVCSSGVTPCFRDKLNMAGTALGVTPSELCPFGTKLKLAHCSGPNMQKP